MTIQANTTVSTAFRKHTFSSATAVPPCFGFAMPSCFPVSVIRCVRLHAAPAGTTAADSKLRMPLAASSQLGRRRLQATPALHEVECTNCLHLCLIQWFQFSLVSTCVLFGSVYLFSRFFCPVFVLSLSLLP